MKTLPSATALFAVACLFSPSLVAAERKPNVVFILIDDFGYECVTADGGESYQTPVMDQLAATGVRFEQCYVQPICTPTRVSLMTGIGNKRNYTHFGHLDPSQTTFANLLQSDGYATCVAGKWQLEGGYEGPGHFGFDEYALWHLTRKTSRYKDPGLDINGVPYDYAHNEYGPDLVSDFALDFIRRKKDIPFFLYYPMMLTHSPYDATPDSPDYLASHTKAKKGVLGHFPDMVAYTDKLIGKVVAELDELKLRDHTLLLILGDNGTGRGTPSKFQGRNVLGGKGTTTTWGTHVPGIGNWPGHFASGKVSSDLIDGTDVLPTLCEATGTPVPEKLKIDGRSFLPQLKGEKGNPRPWLYAWYNPSGGPKAKAEFAHDAQYKLYADGRFYAVEKDDTEKSPLTEAKLDPAARAAKAKLQEALQQFAGPRPPEIEKQGQAFHGEPGEDAEGNEKFGEEAKASKKSKKSKAKPAASEETAAVAGLGAATTSASSAPVSKSGGRAENFQERDANHDGKITLEEFMAKNPGSKAMQQRFEERDTNHDGVLTPEEFSGKTKK